MDVPAKQIDRRALLVWFLAACLVVMFCWFAWRGMRGWKGREVSDLYHFYEAAKALAAGQDIYASGTGGFLYPPLLAFLLVPVTWVPEDGAAAIWICCSVAAMYWIIWAGAKELITRLGAERTPFVLLGSMALATALSFQTIRWQMELQQIDTATVAAMLVGLIWIDRRPWLCGLVLGLAINIKYYAIVTIPYLLLRGRWKAAGAAVVATLAWAMLPALAMGWRGNLDALGKAFSGVSAMLGFGGGEGAPKIPGGIGWHRSVSLTSAASRAVQGLPHESLLTFGLVGIMAGACGALAWALYFRRGAPLFSGRWGASEAQPNRTDLVAVEWLGLVTATLVFSPQTVVRHTLPAVLLNLAAAIVVLSPRIGVSRIPVVIGMATFALGTWLPPGSAGFQASLEWWRSVGGTSWCLLVLYFTLMWTVLQRRSIDQPRAC